MDLKGVLKRYIVGEIDIKEAARAVMESHGESVKGDDVIQPPIAPESHRVNTIDVTVTGYGDGKLSRRAVGVQEQVELAAGESLDDFVNALNRAVSDTLGVETWATEVFSDSVIVRFWDSDENGARAGKMFRVPYTRGDTGAFELGEVGEEVLRRTVFVPAPKNESRDTRVSLPDEAFAIVEVVDGRTVRKFAHHDETGGLDVEKLRTALSNVSSVRGVSASVKQAGTEHLEQHGNHVLAERHTDHVAVAGEELLFELWKEFDLYSADHVPERIDRAAEADEARRKSC